MRDRGTFAAAIAALVCTLAVGCGSDSKSDSTSETAAGKSASTTLTPTQFSELEQLYQAMVPLEKLSDIESQEAVRRLTAGMERACQQVDRGDDPLVAAMADSCRRMAESFAAIGSIDCSTQEQCVALMRKAADTLRDLTAEMRKIKPVVEREVADQACRDFLLDQDRVVASEKAVSAMERFAEAAESGDPEAVERAGTDLEPALAALDEGKSARDDLRTFRTICRPNAG